jgi:2-C-methyl-D-erythritol 4-phosphate cytidylyltransferase / 2-C-methyl-D-erythritol 2,4-cyclodiphosphate synthase
MNHAIIVAGGESKRLGGKVNKILLLLDRKPILHYALEPFEKSSFVDTITIVANKDTIEEITSFVTREGFTKVTNIILGGTERQDSVYAGLRTIKADAEDIVVVHNGANPFITDSLIGHVIREAAEFGASAAGYKAKDTIKETDEKGVVIKTLDRSRLWQMQTPQAAKFGLLTKAYVSAYNDDFLGTDDAMLVERVGGNVKIVESDRDNFKITSYADLEQARLLVYADRVGLGQDSHGFDANKKLVLGGEVIPKEDGMKANSDGDVILHALFNALSQAVGGKSLGFYADPLCEKGIKDSSIYLGIAMDMVKEKGFVIENIGMMLECKKPRLEKFEELIKEKVAKLCSIEHARVGLTVTSGEGLTAWGKGKGIQCFCLVLLKKKIIT